MKRSIPNQNLTLEDVPEFDEWMSFASTFDGYAAHGSFEACAEIGNRRSPATLTEYRTCLFFEFRRFHHFNTPPEEEDQRYIQRLLDGIKACIAEGRLE